MQSHCWTKPNAQAYTVYFTSTQSNTQDTLKSRKHQTKSITFRRQFYDNLGAVKLWEIDKKNYEIQKWNNIFGLYYFSSLRYSGLLRYNINVSSQVKQFINVMNISPEYFHFSALIFNPYTRQVYNLESGSPDLSPAYPYAIACSATTTNEKSLNYRQSFDHKALFVRSYLENKEAPSSQIENCETSILLAAVYFLRNNFDEIKFGYEVSVFLAYFSTCLQTLIFTSSIILISVIYEHKIYEYNMYVPYIIFRYSFNNKYLYELQIYDEMHLLPKDMPNYHYYDYGKVTCYWTWIYNYTYI